MQAPSDWFTLIDSFEETTAALRAMPEADATKASQALMEQALDVLLRTADTPAKMEKLCVWHTDRLYRLTNQVELLDAASFSFLRAVGAVFGVVTKQRKMSVAYLVDNDMPMDRLLGVRAAFNALGFVVASPELLAIELSKESAAHASRADPDAALREESLAVATRLFRETVAECKHVMWLSGTATTKDLVSLAAWLDDAPYVGVFRNDAPVDDTTVQLFRSAGRSDPLAFG